MSTRHQDLCGSCCCPCRGPGAQQEPSSDRNPGTCSGGLHSENKWLLSLLGTPGPSTAGSDPHPGTRSGDFTLQAKHHRIYTQRSLAANEPQVRAPHPGVAHSRLDSPGALPGRLRRPSRGLCDLLFPLTLPRVCLPRVNEPSLPGKVSRPGPEGSLLHPGEVVGQVPTPLSLLRRETLRPSSLCPQPRRKVGASGLFLALTWGLLCCGCGGHGP